MANTQNLGEALFGPMRRGLQQSAALQANEENKIIQLMLAERTRTQQAEQWEKMFERQERRDVQREEAAGQRLRIEQQLHDIRTESYERGKPKEMDEAKALGFINFTMMMNRRRKGETLEAWNERLLPLIGKAYTADETILQRGDRDAALLTRLLEQVQAMPAGKGAPAEGEPTTPESVGRFIGEKAGQIGRATVPIAKGIARAPYELGKGLGAELELYPGASGPGFERTPRAGLAELWEAMKRGGERVGEQFGLPEKLAPIFRSEYQTRRTEPAAARRREAALAATTLRPPVPMTPSAPAPEVAEPYEAPPPERFGEPTAGLWQRITGEPSMWDVIAEMRAEEGEPFGTMFERALKRPWQEYAPRGKVVGD